MATMSALLLVLSTAAQKAILMGFMSCDVVMDALNDYCKVHDVGHFGPPSDPMVKQTTYNIQDLIVTDWG